MDKGIKRTYQICIPHPYRTFYTYLSHQQAIHPSERKLHKLDSLLLKMRGQWRVNTLNQFRHPLDETLNTGLLGDVIILDAVQESGEAPERVGFDSRED